ncbi:hypothetical protein MY3296_008826 [Beauveria thailandica]
MNLQMSQSRTYLLKYTHIAATRPPRNKLATGDRDDAGIGGVELDWLAVGIDWLATGDRDDAGIRGVELDWLAIGIDWLATSDYDDTSIRGVKLDWLAVGID